jgi:hypothetical protein
VGSSQVEEKTTGDISATYLFLELSCWLSQWLGE